MKKIQFFLFVLCCLGTMASSQPSQTGTVGPNLTDYRREYYKAYSNPPWNLGLFELYSVTETGADGAHVYRGVYQWNLPDSIIPAGSTIDTARLTWEMYADEGRMTYNMIFANIGVDLLQPDSSIVWNNYSNVIGSYYYTNNGHLDTAYTNGSSFCNAIASSLQQHRFVLGVKYENEEGEGAGNRSIITNSTVKMYLAFHRPLVNVTVQQLLSDNSANVDSVGRWETDRFQEYAAPKTFQFAVGTTEVLKATQKIIYGQKYNNWSGYNDVTNHKSFSIVSQTSNLLAHLLSLTNNVVIKNELIDGPSLNGGSIDFQDPWLIDSIDAGHGNGPLNRGLNALFYTRTSPFAPDTSTSYSGLNYKGILLNQEVIPGQAYYSVRTTQNITFGSYNGTFMKWASDSAQFDASDSLSTAVNITGGNASIRAQFKAPMVTSDSGKIFFNGQTKLLATPNGQTHYVYISGGSIWYVKKDSSGWSVEYPLTLSGTAKNPSIGYTYNSPYTDLYVIWEDTTSDAVHRIIYRKYSDSGGTWQPADTISDKYGAYTPNGFDAAPIVNSGSAYPVFCWRYGNGTPPGGLAVYFSSDGNSDTKELMSNAPHACSPVIYGSDPVQLAYTDDGVVRYMEFYFGPTPGNPTIADTATLPMPGESRGANPSMINSGINTYVAWDAVKNGKRHIFLSSRPEEGNWSTPVEFTYGSDTLSRPFLSYDTKANYVLLGWQCDSSGQVARVSHPRITGSWSPVAVVGNGRGLQIASNGSQNYASNAWINGNSAPYTIDTSTEAAAGPPELASPSNGAVDQSRTPTLSWNLAFDAEKYHLQVSQNRAFTGTPAYENTNVTADSQTVPSNNILLYHTKYYWRVSSKNYIGEGNYSSIDSFTTAGTAGNASMASQSAVVTGSNGQRKAIRDSNRFLHFVYDSSGAIYYGQSTDGGSSWVYPAKISGTLTNCSQPTITERAETLYVVFGRNISSNTWDVDYTYSTDGGFNWKTTPVQNASSITCPSTGPLPVTQVSSPSDPFELLIAYQRSVDIRTAYTTTRPTISSNWTTITLDGSDSASVTPTLGYDCHSGSGNFYILTKRISQIRLQRFYYTSWDNPGFNYANGSFSGYVYSLSYPTLAYTSNNVEWVAFEGYHQAYYDDVILALKSQNTSEFTEFYDQNYYNHHYHRPVMSGLSGSRAVLLWAADTTSVTKVIYNGSSWGSPTGWGSNNNYPTVTISNPPGDTAFAFWRSGTSSPYSISTNSNGGPLYKTTAPMTYSRRLDILDKRTGNIVSLDLAPPEFDDGLASVTLPFVETNDNFVFNTDNIWQALQTEPVTPGNVASDEMTSIRRIAIHVKNASVSESPVQLRFEAVDAQNGVVRATENVSLSETDTTLSGEDEMSLDVGQLAGHKVFFRLVPAESLNDSDYTVALGHIYCFNDSSALNKSGSKRRDRFAQQKPVEFALFANYPNPFNPVTNVDYALPERAIVRIAVYNTAGQEVARLVDGEKEAGRYSIRWDGSNRASGMYFLRMTAMNESGKTLFNKSEKLVLVK